MKKFDVAIVGAGPAGSSLAICLHKSGLKVALIDKSTFPRDKICGDAISPDVVNQLGKMQLGTKEAFMALDKKIWCNAVRFVSPNYHAVDLKLNEEGVNGYVSPRIDFDSFLYKQALLSDAVKDFSGTILKEISTSIDGVCIQLESESIEAKMVIGADGAHSIVKRTFMDEPMDKDHYCAGLRVYYENVSGFSDDNAVELHFYNELLPGYFWVFPLPGNRANVGLGMLSSFIAKKKPNLKKLLQEIIDTHPNVKDRFANAKALEQIQGFGLPLGSKKRLISGDRFLLLGDAASLINPLSGEGIANAIRSGRVAADHIITAFNLGRFDAQFNQAYDKEIYRRLWGELRLNYWMQIAMRNPARCNLILKWAIGNKLVQEAVLSGFSVKKMFAK